MKSFEALLNIRLMAKALVLYYSFTGNTKKIAEEIASRLQADTERLEDVKSRSPGIGYLWMVLQVIFKTPAKIRPLSKALADYDLVILGAPVWAGAMAAPMRTLIKRRGGDVGKLAVFCTEEGSGGEAVLKNMAALCGKTAVAEMIVLDKEIKSGAFDEKVDAFVCALKGATVTPIDQAARKTA